MAIPTTKKTPHLNEVLIQPEHFMVFVRQAYKRFRHLSVKQREYIRQTLHYAIPREKRTLEMTYITYCSAIETLLSLNNEGTESGHILPNPIWRTFSQDFKKFLRSHESLRSDKVARILLYEKLPELNRVSFRTSFQRLITRYGVDLADLWPVTDTGNDISLLGIRNALIHGRTFTDHQRYSLIAAREHLHWSVERILLGLFNWPTAKSTISKDYLEKNLMMHKGWEADRKILS